MINKTLKIGFSYPMQVDSHKKRPRSDGVKKSNKTQKTDHVAIVALKKDVSLLKSEDKGFRDTGLGGSDITSSSVGAIVIPSINIVPQGDKSDERQGKQIHITSIDYKLGVYSALSTGSSITRVPIRLLLCLDREAHGAAPSVSDVLQSTTLNSFLNLGNGSRFKVLKSWEITLERKPVWNDTGLVTIQYETAYRDQGHLNFEKKAVPIKWSTSNTDGALTGMTTNNIFLLMISDGTLGRLSNAETAFRIRFRR